MVPNFWATLYIHKYRTYHVLISTPPLFEFDRTENSAIRSADPENPSLESNMEWIGCTVFEIIAFKLYCMTLKLGFLNFRPNQSAVVVS